MHVFGDEVTGRGRVGSDNPVAPKWVGREQCFQTLVPGREFATSLLPLTTLAFLQCNVQAESCNIVPHSGTLPIFVKSVEKDKRVPAE